MLIPQALAYSELAGLPAYWGLYSSILCLFTYTIFGTSKHVAIGPAALSAALVATVITWPSDWPEPIHSTAPSSAELASVLSFFTGIILLAVGLLQLGWIVNFISAPILTGFISAAAFTIPLGQLPKLFGLSLGSDRYFLCWAVILDILSFQT